MTIRYFEVKDDIGNPIALFQRDDQTTEESAYVDGAWHDTGSWVAGKLATDPGDLEEVSLDEAHLYTWRTK